MNLNVEIARGLKPGCWVWRVRSDETPVGEACLAVGTSRISEDDARRIAHTVKDALGPIFKTYPFGEQP
jgi:hypothetical protein